MKFVTVMDMWLLIINLILLGCIAYYGRRLIKLIARIVTRLDMSDVEKERQAIIEIIKHERDMQSHVTSTTGKEDSDTTLILEEIIDKINNRSRKKELKK